jgi:hypothetical protein
MMRTPDNKTLRVKFSGNPSMAVRSEVELHAMSRVVGAALNVPTRRITPQTFSAISASTLLFMAIL